MIYHTGFIAAEREFAKGDSDATRVKKLAIDKLADEYWAKAMRGEGHLMQRRISEGLYEYHYVEGKNRGMVWKWDYL